ncbi:hypothetical protein, partial [Thiolapillus sp.]|uniref:hypothetical protein n=1 Tax=Thiolapillus sp. TaxID=2017437 RepID=UPI003AF48C68
MTSGQVLTPVTTALTIVSTTFTESLQPLPSHYNLYPVTTTFTESLQPLPSHYNLDRVTTALTGFEKNDRVPTPVTTALTSFQKEEVFSTAL